MGLIMVLALGAGVEHIVS